MPTNPLDPNLRARIIQRNTPLLPFEPSSTISAQQGVQSVEFAFAILRAIEVCPDQMTLKGIAEAVGAQPSKVHHYLVSLGRSGVVEQVAGAAYRLGPFALQLGFTALHRLARPDIALAHVVALRERTQETAFAAVWGNRGPTIVCKAEGSHPLSIDVTPGLVMPLLKSATGRVFMTWLPSAKWKALAAAEETTADDLPDRIERKHIINEARRLGVAIVIGSFHPRITACSAPVFGYGGELLFSMTILGWTGDFDAGPGGSVTSALIEQSVSLSAACGYRQ